MATRAAAGATPPRRTSSDASLPSTGNEAGQFPFTASGAITTANCIVDPQSKTCFPYTNVSGNNYVATIPTTRFDKASLALLNYIPVAIRNGTPFSYLQPNSQNYDEFIGRYDQEAHHEDRMTARYFSTSSTWSASSIPKTTSPIRISPTFSIRTLSPLKHTPSTIIC